MNETLKAKIAELEHKELERRLARLERRQQRREQVTHATTALRDATREIATRTRMALRVLAKGA